MSALANTNTHHANVDAVQLNSEPAVTSISVTARIDYIQRFSKQAVLVIDPDAGVYTQAARQFLISLSKENITQETNAAYVSASTKLNDIQMRCRLIEQLFANTLFDPERSLAVSILQLNKQSKESITIVVEHAHALSLQIKYELCQLVDVANKTHHKINVVLFGKEQAAHEVAANKTIFKNKLAIIDAKSGQLFAIENAKFKNESIIFSRKFWLKLMFTLTLFATLIGLSWYLLIKFDNFPLSELALFNTTKIEQPVTSKSAEVNTVLLASEKIEKANAKDVQAALFGKVTLLAEEEKKSAQATDILQALAFESIVEPKELVSEAELPNMQPVLAEAEVKTTMQVNPEQVKSTQDNKQTRTNSALQLTPDYYLNASTGYVIQITGFTDMTFLIDFISEYPNLEYFSYQRELNEQPFIVLTSKIFTDKTLAREAMSILPPALLKLGPWLKSISAIKREINTFKG